MSTQIPIVVINLDRRPDRLAFMSDQLQALGLTWTRKSALDAQTATDAQIGKEVALENHLIRMGRGSQCCAISNFDIYRDLLASDAPAVLVLQDDVELSPDIVPLLTDISLIPDGIELIQLEHFGSKKSSILCGPPHPTAAANRNVHQLYSRVGGAGCYLITRRGAEIILANKGILNVPIDHLLFSPNSSSVFAKVGVGVISPALATQRMDQITSDISAERRRSKTLSLRLRRLWFELNRVPSQLAAIAFGARWLHVKFKE